MKPTEETNSVQQRSKSTARDPSWLTEKVYKPKRQRTLRLVQQAVNALLATGQKVSLTSVAAKTKEVDPDGAGVSESALLNNAEAKAYFDHHRTWRGPTRRRLPKALSSVPESPRIKLGRDLDRVWQRYMRMTKEELVHRLLTLEQAYAAREEQRARMGDDVLRELLRSRGTPVPRNSQEPSKG